MRVLEAYSQLLPITSWNPIGVSGLAMNVPGTGSSTPGPFTAQPASDTSPELRDALLADSTAVTAIPVLPDDPFAPRVDTEPWVVGPAVAEASSAGNVGQFTPELSEEAFVAASEILGPSQPGKPDRALR